MKCEEIIWSGKAAFEFSAGNYGALVVPSLGANVLGLWYISGSERFEILRTPANAGTLLDNPFVYGIPILFPANRVADGFYEWDGIRYEFPRNSSNNMHIHGVLHNRPWNVTRRWSDSKGVWVRMAPDSEFDGGLKRFFPIDVRIHLDIGLSKDGLVHLFTVENRSKNSFPIGLAYHTAFNVPFSRTSNAQNIRISVPIKARCIDDPVSRLPAGGVQELNELEKRIASPEGGPPMETILDYLYTARLDVPNVAVLRDISTGWEVRYSAINDCRYWIIWNKNAKESFTAIEPQTWMSNAMKQPNPEQFGAVFLPPGRTWTNRTEIAMRHCGE